MYATVCGTAEAEKVKLDGLKVPDPLLVNDTVPVYGLEGVTTKFLDVFTTPLVGPAIDSVIEDAAGSTTENDINSIDATASKKSIAPYLVNVIPEPSSFTTSRETPLIKAVN